MKSVYIFTCSNKQSRHAFTFDEAGLNLPTDRTTCNGSWQHFKTIQISHDSPALLGGRPTDILTGIESAGYHIIDLGVDFNEIV